MVAQVNRSNNSGIKSIKNVSKKKKKVCGVYKALITDLKMAGKDNGRLAEGNTALAKELREGG